MLAIFAKGLQTEWIGALSSHLHSYAWIEYITRVVTQHFHLPLSRNTFPDLYKSTQLVEYNVQLGLDMVDTCSRILMLEQGVGALQTHAQELEFSGMTFLAIARSEVMYIVSHS